MTKLICQEDQIAYLLTAAMDMQRRGIGCMGPGTEEQYPFFWEDGDGERRELRKGTFQETGQMLMDRNFLAWKEQEPDLRENARRPAFTITWAETKPWVRLEAVEVVSSAHGYQNSSKGEGWRESGARSFIQKLLRISTTELPGYRRAPGASPTGWTRSSRWNGADEPTSGGWRMGIEGEGLKAQHPRPIRDRQDYNTARDRLNRILLETERCQDLEDEKDILTALLETHEKRLVQGGTRKGRKIERNTLGEIAIVGQGVTMTAQRGGSGIFGMVQSHDIGDDMWVNPAGLKQVALGENRHTEKQVLRPQDLLVTSRTKNTVQAALFPEGYPRTVVNATILIVRPREKTPGVTQYLWAHITSRKGQAQLRGLLTTFGPTTTSISGENLMSLPVEIPGEEKLRKIAQLIEAGEEVYQASIEVARLRKHALRDAIIGEIAREIMQGGEEWLEPAAEEK